MSGLASAWHIAQPADRAHLAPRIILILGGANLIASGFAMVASNYLATRSEHEQFDQAEAVELRHIKAVPEGEREEMSEILRGLGIAGDLLGPGGRGNHRGGSSDS